MGKRITLEEYVAEFYPRILEQYKDYSKTYHNLTPEKVCKKDLDFSKISKIAAENMRKNGIIQVGHLVRVVMLYKNLRWVSGAGQATWERFYNQLIPLGIDLKHMDRTDSNIKGYAWRNYRRDLPEAVRNVFSGEIVKQYENDGLFTIGALVWRYANEEHWILAQPLSVRNVLAKYAPTMQDLKKEFKREE